MATYYCENCDTLHDGDIDMPIEIHGMMVCEGSVDFCEQCEEPVEYGCLIETDYGYICWPCEIRSLEKAECRREDIFNDQRKLKKHGEEI